MVKKYGKAFRYFRKLNGYSLEQAAGKTISKSQLSRFERGENDIAITKFFELLSNISVSIDSFYNYLNDYKRFKNDEFLVALSPNFYSLNTEKLKIVQSEQQKLFDSTGNTVNKLNSIIVKGLLNQIDSEYLVSIDDLSLVYEYLFQKEQWEFYEIALIGNLYHLFEIDYIYRVGKEILDRTHYYKNIGKNKNLVISACLNFWFYCLENSHLVYAEYFEKQVKQLLNDETKVFERSVYKFIEGYKIYLTESKETGIKQMQNVVTFLNFIGSKSLAIYFQNRLTQLLG